MDFGGGECRFFRGHLLRSSTYVLFCEGAAAPAAEPFRRFYSLVITWAGLATFSSSVCRGRLIPPAPFRREPSCTRSNALANGFAAAGRDAEACSIYWLCCNALQQSQNTPSASACCGLPAARLEQYVLLAKECSSSSACVFQRLYHSTVVCELNRNWIGRLLFWESNICNQVVAADRTLAGRGPL